MLDLRSARLAGGLMAAVLVAGPVGAQVAPEKNTPLAAREYRHPRLHIENRVQRVEERAEAARRPLLDDLAELRVASASAYIDPRTGRWATLMPVEPLLPGTGEGNAVAWSDLGVKAPTSVAGWERAAWSALVAYLRDHAGALRLDVSELAQPGRVAVHDDGALVQIHAPRVVGGVPVRESFLTAVINHGNLVLFGAHNWGTVRVATEPSVSEAEALQSLAAHLHTDAASAFRREANLALVPYSTGPLATVAELDRGLDYRLVWVLSPQFPRDLGTYEALVDAHSGELLAFTDTNQYQSVRRVQGGVYPVSNDGVPPDGTEQPGWPFPFANLVTGSGNFFTDTGGNLERCVTGNISSTLTGRYVRMNDTCGAVNETAAGNLDFGVSAGTDCTVPAGSSLGNTHATRTGFFELNKIAEQGRGQLPNNTWLQGQLNANMNIIATCNASWNGSVNFFRSGGGCNNTGEIAAIFDHEWGHGMDDNDVNGAIANPGEGIADIYMALRLKESCVGRNFRNTNCGGYGNPCIACTGVRDIDWAQRLNNTPTTITWIDANCGAGPAPCGGGVHCEGSVFAEAVWDLFNRDLPTFGYSPDTALEIATRTTYFGAGPAGPLFQCTQGSGGCPASAAYLNYLAADDDNGNINTGTPHFQAIRDAFNRHGIGCATPATFSAGCPNIPQVAPVVTGVAGDKSARLTWPSVPFAVKYRVYRTEGVFGCNFGKVLLGETFGTDWTDTGLQNGRQYYYTVAAVGLSNTCLGPMSACTTVTPAPGNALSLSAATTTAPTTGDGDVFVDNCEQVTVSFGASNTGANPQTNVRIVAVQPIGHPGMQVISLGPTTPSLPVCGNATLSFSIRAVDMVPDAVVRLRVDVTSDQISPNVRSQIVQFGATEGDGTAVASQTFDFEASAEGWQLVTGTFNRTNVAPGGAGGAGTFYFASSSFLDNQCDEVQSPVIVPSATTTLSLQNNYDIEIFSAGSWYDRANVGLLNVNDGSRTVVVPDGGRPYNAFGSGGPCTLDQQQGWAAANPTWGGSSWTAAALGSATVAGQPRRVNIRYGTDPAANGFGFRFDQVTLTNFTLKVADTLSNQCVGGNLPPVANPDTSNAGTFGPVTISVLANDNEPNGQCMRVAAVTNPANGVAVINSVGCPNTDTVTYIPSPSCGIPCNDSFQYTVSDQNGGTATATVTINQVPVELQQFKVE